MSEKSYYEILNIDNSATTEQIKSAWKKMVMKCHPDKLSDDKKKWGEEQIKLVNHAHSVLGDPEKRKRYDEYGSENHEEMDSGLFDASDLFNMFNAFGNFNSFTNESNHSVIDAEINIEIIESMTLEELFYGKELKKQIRRNMICTEL